MGRLTFFMMSFLVLLSTTFATAANLTETAQWENGIYRIELSDPVEGGENGVDNRQAKQLGNRTQYLKREQDTLKSTLSQNSADISNINDRINNNTSNLSGVTNQVNTNTTDISALKNLTTTHTSQINALQSNSVISAHDHDERYYTKSQTDTRYASVSHNHSGTYLTESEIDTKIAVSSNMNVLNVSAGTDSANNKLVSFNRNEGDTNPIIPNISMPVYLGAVKVKRPSISEISAHLLPTLTTHGWVSKYAVEIEMTRIQGKVRLLTTTKGTAIAPSAVVAYALIRNGQVIETQTLPSSNSTDQQILNKVITVQKDDKLLIAQEKDEFKDSRTLGSVSVFIDQVIVSGSKLATYVPDWK